MPRMNILNTVEREAFNSPPVFSSLQGNDKGWISHILDPSPAPPRQAWPEKFVPPSQRIEQTAAAGRSVCAFARS